MNKGSDLTELFYVSAMVTCYFVAIHFSPFLRILGSMSEFLDRQFVRRYLITHNYTQTLSTFDEESASDNLNDCVDLVYV